MNKFNHLFEKIHNSLQDVNLISEDNILNIDDFVEFYVSQYVYYGDRISKYSPEDTNIVVKWITREVKRRVATDTTPFSKYNSSHQGPEWYKEIEDGKMFIIPLSREEYEYTRTIDKDLFRCLAYFRSLTPKEKSKFIKLSIEEVLKRYEEEFVGKPQENKDYKVVMTFEDGFKIVELLTAKGFCYHGKKASNCVSPQMYADHKENYIIYGLWNSNNSVKATIGLDRKRGTLNELASFSPKYYPYIFEFIKSRDLLPEVHGGLSDEILLSYKPYIEYLAAKGHLAL